MAAGSSSSLSNNSKGGDNTELDFIALQASLVKQLP